MSHFREIRKIVGKQPMIIVGASIILQDNSKNLLMVHRTDNNTWGLPAGMLELGESLEACAKRELEEETGLIASKLELLRITSGSEMHYTYPNGDEVFIVSASFRCVEYTGKACVNDHESKAVGFFPLQALPMPLNPPSEVVISKLIEDGFLL